MSYLYCRNETCRGSTWNYLAVGEARTAKPQVIGPDEFVRTLLTYSLVELKAFAVRYGISQGTGIG